MMIPIFDIFRTEMGGTYWVEAAVNLEDAKARVQALQKDIPGEYFIFNQKTGARFPEQLEGVTESSKRRSGSSEARP